MSTRLREVRAVRAVRSETLRPSRRPNRILIGVTVDYSLDFYAGLPSALVADGWDVHIASHPGPHLESLRTIRGINVHPLPMRRDPSPLRDGVALARWLKLIWVVRPSVTFIGTPKAALLGNLAARFARVPRRIYVLHGLRFETSSGQARRFLTFLEKLTAHSAHEVLCVSPSLRQLAVRMSIATERKAIVLGAGSCNGIDVGHFDASFGTQVAADLGLEIGLDPSRPVIGFVGRLTRDKGLPELAGALRALRSRGIEVQLLVVGGIDDPSGQAALAELRQTGQSIIAVGHRPDVAPFYSMMDVFCLPSLREGLGTVVLEAMASRVVVVGTDSTGIVDLISEGVTGYLVPCRSERRLAEALQLALEDRAKSAVMVETAFEMVSSKYDSKFVQAHIRAYLAQSDASATATSA